MDNSVGPFEVPSGKPARGRVTAPPSKSHAIRALVCGELSDGGYQVRTDRLVGEDVERAYEALAVLINHKNQCVDLFTEDLGYAVDSVLGPHSFVPHLRHDVDLGGSATAFRLLCAVAALRSGATTLTGDRSLRSRPMDSTVLAVRQLGVSVEAETREGWMYAPITVSGGPPFRNQVDVDPSSTSHPLSALLLVGPLIRGGLTVRSQGIVGSRPYVDLTTWTMRQFGVEVSVDDNVWRVPEARYVAPEPVVEILGDWSSAAFLLGAGAINGDVELTGLEFDSPQADRRVVDLLRDFGATVDRTSTGVRVRGNDRRPLDVDLRDAPDLAPLVGALGCVATGTTRVRGAAHLRIKESDRIATVVAAARALGCEARELPDGFEIVGPAKHGGLIVTQHDHRIAMAFAVAGLAIPGVVIDDPACVAKSYPGFWDDLARLTGG